jgi:hypothetical protein
MLKYDGEILIKQVGILNGVQNTGQGKFVEENGTYFIQTLADPTEYNFPFQDFPDTQSRFAAVIEFEDDENYEIFELTLHSTTNIFDEFEVIEDKEYFLFREFLAKREAEKLDKELPVNKTPPGSKVKI